MFDQLAYQLSMAEAWVYMLRCVDSSLYTGWTVDVQRRVARHRAGTPSQHAVARGRLSLSAVLVRPEPLTTLLIGASRPVALAADDPFGRRRQLVCGPQSPSRAAASRAAILLGDLAVMLGHAARVYY